MMLFCLFESFGHYYSRFIASPILRQEFSERFYPKPHESGSFPVWLKEQALSPALCGFQAPFPLMFWVVLSQPKVASLHPGARYRGDSLPISGTSTCYSLLSGTLFGKLANFGFCGSQFHFPHSESPGSFVHLLPPVAASYNLLCRVFQKPPQKRKL